MKDNHDCSRQTARPAATGESEESPEISAELEAELTRCRLPLRDFGPAPSDHPGFARSDLEAAKITIPADRLPVIASLHLVMRLLIGTYGLGRAESSLGVRLHVPAGALFIVAGEARPPSLSCNSRTGPMPRQRRRPDRVQAGSGSPDA